MMSKKTISIIVLASVLVAVISGGAVYLLLRQPAAQYQYDTVKKDNILESVSAVGQVKSAETVDLSLILSGRVATVNAKVGDSVKAGQVILTLDNADLAAQVAQAQAVLNKQLAGNTADYIAQLQAALDKANNDLMQAQGAGSGPESSKLVSNAYDDLYSNLQSVQISVASALTAADNILGVDNEIANDSFEDYLSVLNSSKLVSAEDKYDVAKASKQALDDKLNSLTDSSNHTAINETAVLAKAALNDSKNLLFATAEMLDNTPPVGRLNQTSLDGLKTGIQNTRTNITGKYAALVSQEHAVQVAHDNYVSLKTVADRAAAALADAKNPPRDVDTAASRASLALAQANYAKTIMRSPIDGVITKQDAKVGGMISPSVALVSVINPKQYQVDVYLSETDMAKVQVGNKATITFDSFGADEKFPATLVKVDPAGVTQANGITNYKVTLQFDNSDDRVKAGLTANVKIVTAEKTAVLVLPNRDVMQKNGEYYVLRNNANNVNAEEVKVVVGVKSEDEKREIISGLNEGDKVVSYGLAQ